MDAAQAGNKFNTYARRLEREVGRAGQASVDDLEASARRWSSGTDRSRGKKNTRPINKLSGTLFGAWQRTEPTMVGGEMHTGVWNSAFYAGYVERGTKRVGAGADYASSPWHSEPRPITEWMEADVQATVAWRMERAVERTLK